VASNIVSISSFFIPSLLRLGSPRVDQSALAIYAFDLLLLQDRSPALKENAVGSRASCCVLTGRLGQAISPLPLSFGFAIHRLCPTHRPHRLACEYSPVNHRLRIPHNDMDYWRRDNNKNPLIKNIRYSNIITLNH
jgi:hypothetical protein